MSFMKIAGSAITQNQDGEWLVMLDVAQGDPRAVDLSSLEISEGRLLLTFKMSDQQLRHSIDIGSGEGKNLARFLYDGQGLLVYAANGNQKAMFGPCALVNTA